MDETMTESTKKDFIPMTPAMRIRLAEMELVKRSFIDGYLTAFGADGEWRMAEDASGWRLVEPQKG